MAGPVSARPYALTVADTEHGDQRARLLEATTVGKVAEAVDTLTPLTFFLVVTETDSGEVVGAARVVAGSAIGNRTLDASAEPPWGAPMPQVAIAAGLEAEHTWDVATLAVDGTRLAGRPAQAEVALALYHGLWACAATHGARSLTAMLDDRVLTRLRMLGIPFRALPGLSAAPYLGSASTTPAFVHLSDVHRTLAAEPAVGDYLLRGDGFAQVLVPLPSYWEDHPSLTSAAGHLTAPLPR